MHYLFLLQVVVGYALFKGVTWRLHRACQNSFYVVLTDFFNSFFGKRMHPYVINIAGLSLLENNDNKVIPFFTVFGCLALTICYIFVHFRILCIPFFLFSCLIRLIKSKIISYVLVSSPGLTGSHSSNCYSVVNAGIVWRAKKNSRQQIQSNTHSISSWQVYQWNPAHLKPFFDSREVMSRAKEQL